MSSYPNNEQILFPNASPNSLDNYEHKKKPFKEGLKVDNDDGLNKAMSSLMTEYVKDTKNLDEKIKIEESAVVPEIIKNHEEAQAEEVPENQVE